MQPEILHLPASVIVCLYPSVQLCFDFVSLTHRTAHAYTRPFRSHTEPDFKQERRKHSKQCVYCFRVSQILTRHSYDYGFRPNSAVHRARVTLTVQRLCLIVSVTWARSTSLVSTLTVAFKHKQRSSTNTFDFDLIIVEDRYYKIRT